MSIFVLLEYTFEIVKIFKPASLISNKYRMFIKKLQTKSYEVSMNKRLTESQSLTIGHENNQTVTSDGKLTKFHRNVSQF